LRDYWGCKPTFLSHSSEIWHEGGDLAHPAQDKFRKNRLRGYTPFGQINTKNTNFGDFGAVSPHFKSDNGEIWHESAGLGLPPLFYIL